MERVETIGLNSNLTYYFDHDGVRVWPCPCGERHREYNDWAHHVCGHDEADLVGLYHGEKEGSIVAFCAECGKGFTVDLSTVED